jgi:hypothetical protein
LIFGARVGGPGQKKKARINPAALLTGNGIHPGDCQSLFPVGSGQAKAIEPIIYERM